MVILIQNVRLINKKRGELLMKKFLGVLLSFSLMLTMFTATVYAEENADAANVKEVTYEAKIGETFYETLGEALTIGGEVQLLKDVSVNEIMEITNDTTLDWEILRLRIMRQQDLL